MANNVVPDQTPRLEASDLGLHCLPRPIRWNALCYYGIPLIDRAQNIPVILGEHHTTESYKNVFPGIY